MDCCLHFRWFFDSNIDFLGKARSSEMCASRKIWTPKNLIFLRKNTSFYKIDDFCFDLETDEKHKKKEQTSIQNQRSFRHAFFKDFGVNLGGFWCPSWGSRAGVPATHFQVAPHRRPRASQERPKSVPRGPKSVPRASKSAQERPQRVPRATKTCPGGARGATSGTFLWIS